MKKLTALKEIQAAAAKNKSAFEDFRENIVISATMKE